MPLDRRLRVLERHRPVGPMPEHITIVRRRDDNPEIPIGFEERDIVLLSLERGNRCEEHIFVSSAEAR